MNTNQPFQPFPKIARLSREIIITEKIDGTNASVVIERLQDNQPVPNHSLGMFDYKGKVHYMAAGSRTRWITPETDNFGFAAWVAQNFDQLKALGPGHHFGEWWGRGIQRGYGMNDRWFSLFNTARWRMHGREPQQILTGDPHIVKTQDILPPCCHLVPELRRGMLSTDMAESALHELRERGSLAAPGFMTPEGIVVFHTAANVAFKKTIKDDHQPKGNQ